MTPTSPWLRRRALVTGATGMVGSWLVRRLLDEGASVIALVRDADPQSELIRSGTISETTVVNGRVEDYAVVERAIVDHEVDTVFHLAAQTIVGTAVRSPRATLEANVAGTWNVLDVARLQPDLVARVVVASSDKAYGEAVLPYQESHPLAGSAPYDVSKSCADLIAHAYATTYGVPVVITRCGNVYGGGDLNWSRLVPGTIRALLDGEQPVLRSDGSFRRDYLYVEDVVDAYLLVADAASDTDGERGQAFNISDETPMTVLDMYGAVCKAAGLGQVEPRILGGGASEIRDQWLDSTKARTLLGWGSTFGLDDGLDRTVAWYRDYFDRIGAR